jgi:hypothetical protein
MSAYGFILTSTRGIVFTDSAQYMMKCHKRWTNYEAFERDICAVWSGARKFLVVVNTVIVMEIGQVASSLWGTLWKNDSTLEDYAQAIATHENNFRGHVFNREPADIYVIGYDKARKENRAFWLTDKIEVCPKTIIELLEKGLSTEEVSDQLNRPADTFRVEEVRLPCFMLTGATHEPEQILSAFINAGELIKTNTSGTKSKAQDSVWQTAIDRMLYESRDVLREISRQYSAYMIPWKIAMIDKHGARPV